MRNLMTKATLGVALGAAALTAAAPAEAQRYRHHRDRDHSGAIVAGVAGLAIGAALASGSRRDRGYYYDDRYYDRGYYNRGYYNDGYYARPYHRGYRSNCYTRRVYDPYIGRRVRVRYCN